MTASNTYGNSVVEVFKNNSGGTLVLGDVAIVDTTSDESVTTTTVASTTAKQAVALETIPTGQSGRFVTSGYVSLVNVNASVTRGHYGSTYSVAKQATDVGSARTAGTFCQFLKDGTTPSAILFSGDLSAGSLTDHTHAATGSGSNGGGATLSPTTLNVPQSSPGTTEGRIGWDTTAHELLGYDTQRARGIADIGWVPWACQPGWVATAALTTAINLAAAGGSMAIPIVVPGHMLLDAVVLWNTDTSGARQWRWDLYVEDLNNGNSGENTLRRVATSNGDQSFTSSGAAARTFLDPSAPEYLAPGLYWLVIQNTHASNTFGIGSTAMNLGLVSLYQTKTTSNPNGATLDFVAATWTKGSSVIAALLMGRVFGQTARF